MRKNWNLIQIIAGLLIGYALFYYYSGKYYNFEPKDFALGLSNHAKKASGTDFLRFHREASAIKSLTENMIKEKSAGNNIILIFGTSQLHAINDYKEGDSLTVEYVNDFFIKNNKPWRLYQISYPNASYCDFLAFYSNFRQNNAPLDLLVLELHYNTNLGSGLYDGNLQGLNKVYFSSMQNNDSGIIFLNDAIDKYKTNNSSSKDKKVIESIVTKGTPQEVLEKIINRGFDSVIPNFDRRKTLMSKLDAERINFMVYFNIFTFKDALKIEAPTLSREIVKRNTDAFNSLIKMTQFDGVHIIMYKQPIKQPFIAKSPDYDKYYMSLEKSFANNNHIFYTDYSFLVPAKDFVAEEDIWHFNNEGHKIVGNRLATLIDSLVNVKYFQ